MKRTTQPMLFKRKEIPKMPAPNTPPVLDVAKKILDDAPKKTLHVNQIADEAIRKNLSLGLDRESLVKKLSSALAANVKSKDPTFSKVDGKKPGTFRKGIYRLRRKADAVSAAIRSRPQPPVVSTNYLGKAGEYAVMSELLFWGFNASLMSVDDGIDITASKSGKYFHLQVKTATDDFGEKYSFRIKQTAFDTHHAATTFYILVMRRNGIANYAIIPSHQIKLWQDMRLIAGSHAISITITADHKRKRYALGEVDISLLVDDFSIIR